MPPELENILTNRNFTDSALLEVKDSKISEIENTSCVRNVMEVTPVFGIERVPWVAASILIRVNDGVFICTYNVQSSE